MAFVRASKFRHVFGETPKAELTHTGVDASISGSCEGDGLAASPALFAYTLKNGRDVAVLPLGEWKRHVSPPYMMAHTGAVLDMAFSPFHDTTLATCSADSLIRIWGLGEEGVTAKIGPEDDECLCELHGHERKVVLVKWHPSAEYVIATAGQDGEVKVWDVEKGLEKLCVGGGDRLNPTSLDWNHDGSLIAIVKKKPGQGAQLSVFDPRLAGEGLAATLVHEGIRSAKCAWLGGGASGEAGLHMICSVGFTKQSKRQVRIWDSRNLDAGPVSQQDIDQSASKLSPFWEEDSRILFLCGKGSGSVRYYELSQDHKNLHYISDFKGTTQQKGITQLPKRACNSVKCEIARFCKLTSSGTVEPLVFKVPRRSEAFQKDIYPSGCGSGKAELSADDYFGKKNAGEAKMSMDPREGFVPIGPFGSGAGSGVDVGKTRTKRGSVSKLGKAKHPKGMSNGPRGSCGDGVVTSAADAKKDKEAAASTAKDIGLLRKKLAVAEERIAALEESVRKLLKEKQEE